MPASRINGIDLSGVRKMFKKAPEGAINLGLGQPDFNPPQHVMDAFKKAVDEGFNSYCHVEGVFALRKAIADRLRRYRPDLTWRNVIITSGGTEALLSADFALLEQGDEVLIPDPGFIMFEAHAKLCGAKPVPYILRIENGFLPDIEEIKGKISDKTKAIIVNSPSNPTGSVHQKELIKAITDIAEDYDLYIISDEVYDEMVYDPPHRSYLGDYDKVVHINSFSKTFAMNGWRLGYLVADEETIEYINKFHYYTIGCPNTPAQHAAIEALQGPKTHLKRMLSEFKARREVIIDELNTIEGITCHKPMGAFYAFPKFTYSVSSEQMAYLLLDAGLICAPGTAFGPAGEWHLRFSYANSRENIKLGMDILRRVVSTL